VEHDAAGKDKDARMALGERGVLVGFKRDKKQGVGLKV
jgi:hypothetical protein